MCGSRKGRGRALGDVKSSLHRLGEGSADFWAPGDNTCGDEAGENEEDDVVEHAI